MSQVTHETSLLIKAAGIVVGECLFGLYGSFLFMRLLGWFEMTFPGAEAIGVAVGAAVGYGVAAGALRMYAAARTHATSSHYRLALGAYLAGRREHTPSRLSGGCCVR